MSLLRARVFLSLVFILVRVFNASGASQIEIPPSGKFYQGLYFDEPVAGNDPTEHDIKANVRKRADSDPPSEELMFTDPDNIRVQIQDVSYCGGKGVLGNDCKNR